MCEWLEETCPSKNHCRTKILIAVTKISSKVSYEETDPPDNWWTWSYWILNLFCHYHRNELFTALYSWSQKGLTWPYLEPLGTNKLNNVSTFTGHVKGWFWIMYEYWNDKEILGGLRKLAPNKIFAHQNFQLHPSKFHPGLLMRKPTLQTFGEHEGTEFWSCDCHHLRNE